MNYLTEREVAEKLKTNQRKISKLRKSGLIKGIKLSRHYVYQEKDIDEFFNDYLGKDLSAEHYKMFEKKWATHMTK